MENHEKYFAYAAEVAQQATCTRARCGSVIVSTEGEVIGSGFNAPALGLESQRMCGNSYDISVKPKSDKTCCIHAEWNAILDASTNYGNQILGSTLYFMRVDNKGKWTNAGDPYCTVCSRLALQSGVSVFGLWESKPRMIGTESYNLLSYAFHNPS